MSVQLKHNLLISASAVACCLGLATPAFGSTNAAPADIQDTSAANTEADEDEEAIVVTARRTEEDIQDVPISITVFNQEQLRNQNINSAVDLSKIAPGLIASQKYGPDNASFSMRGFFQELRTSASVGVYFADVISPRAPGSTTAGDGAGPGSFFDLQNVQVLKGPQGTLFGRNTTGGAVLLVPQRPTDQLEGYGEFSYGSHTMMRIQGVLNLPIADTIRLRVGVDWNQRDGYLKNISPVGPKRFADVNSTAARASLVIDLTPELENYTIFTYAKSDTNGQVAHMEMSVPGRQYSAASAAQIAREAGNGVFQIANTQPDPLRWQETLRLINTTTWSPSDSLTIKNIASFSRIKVRERGDPFGTYFLFPIAMPQLLVPFAAIRSVPGGYSNHQRSFTEEFRLQGKVGEDRLLWQAGVYFESSKGLSPAGTAGPSGLNCLGEPTEFQCQAVTGVSGNITWQQQESDFQNIGVYAQGSLKLTDWLTFTGGARYTWDKVESNFWQYIVRFPAPNTPTFGCLYPTLDPNPVTLPEILALSRCYDTAKVKSSAPTWTMSLEVRPSDDILAFIKYSRGYRQGSTNPFSLPGFKTFADEKVDVYEAGIKTSWRGAMPGFLNATVFYNDFTNQQIQAGALRPGLAPNAVILNAGASRMYGLEVEANIRPFTGMRLGANYSYLHTKLLSATFPGVFGPLPELGGAPGYRLPDGSAVFPTSTVGTPLPLSPKHQLVLSATYRLPVSEDVGTIEIGASYSYTSAQFFTFSNIPRGRFPAYGLVNANLNWNGIAGSPIDVSLFATNLFNKKYIILVNEQSSSGFVSRNYGEPRMIGGRLRFNFGDR